MEQFSSTFENMKGTTLSKYLTWLPVLFCLQANAQVYKGTIGKYPIVFEIMQDEYHDYQARYYYTSSKAEIYLQAGKTKTDFFVEAGQVVSKKETFTLVASEKGKKLKGKWSNTPNKTLPVELTQVDPATVKLNKPYSSMVNLKKNQLFECMRINNLVFKKIKEENWYENTVLEWYDEPLSKISFFRIKSTDKAVDLDKLNKRLEEIHVDKVVAFVDCEGNGPRGGEYGFSGSLSYLSAQLISIYYTEGYYCGGAHPDGGGGGITIDLKTNKELALSHLYWFSDKSRYVENISDNQDENMNDFNETWAEVVKKHYPDKMTPAGMDDCDYSDPYNWSKYTWYLTQDGLFVGAYFPRVIRTCDLYEEWPVIPYKDLEKYRVNQKQYTLK